MYNKESQKKYAKTPKGIFNTIKKQRGDKLEIEKKDFIEWYLLTEKKCAYCGISEKEIKSRAEMYNLRTDKLTIDRKNNSVGYKKGNIVFACDSCNTMKSNLFTHSEMLILGKKSRKLIEMRE